MVDRKFTIKGLLNKNIQTKSFQLLTTTCTFFPLDPRKSFETFLNCPEKGKDTLFCSWFRRNIYFRSQPIHFSHFLSISLFRVPQQKTSDNKMLDPIVDAEGDDIFHPISSCWHTYTHQSTRSHKQAKRCSPELGPVVCEIS